MITKILRAHFSKIYDCPSKAIEGIASGHRVLIGGFGICGIPMNLIHSLAEKRDSVRDITVISNTAGIDHWGVGVLLRTGQVKRIIGSYVGANHQFERQYLHGELEVELVPQGTLAEKIRAAGAGIPAFYTPTGYKTLYAEGKFPIKFKKGTTQVEIMSTAREVKNFHGQNFILEESLKGDFAFIKAHKADRKGNLVFNKTARNFNSDMGTAGKVVVAEVDEIVDELDPNLIQLPAVYVDRIYKSDPRSKFSEKKIQRLVNFGDKDKETNGSAEAAHKAKIAKRAAQEVKNGMNINLGIGIPSLLPAFLPEGVSVDIHAENGIMGVGDYPSKGQEDPDLINAGKESITCKPGGSYFSSSMSFDIIRGGHLDITILGALQVSKTGDIANWIIPGKMVRGMGGAMDLVACKSRVIVAMEHTSKGQIKLLDQCSLPLTAESVVSTVITEKAVFQNINGKLYLTEIAHESSLQDIQKHTGFKIETYGEVKRF